MNKVSYEKFIEFYCGHNYEFFLDNKDKVDNNILINQFAIELIMPEDLFIKLVDESIKKIEDIKYLESFNYNIKSTNVLNVDLLKLLSILESKVESFDLNLLFNLLSKAFMSPKELVEIRFYQLYSTNNRNLPVIKESLNPKVRKLS